MHGVLRETEKWSPSQNIPSYLSNLTIHCLFSQLSDAASYHKPNESNPYPQTHFVLRSSLF
jgi:hypothetical protein